MSTQHAPAPTVSTQNWNQNSANTYYAVAAILGLACPGALPGALLASALWSASRAPLLLRLGAAAIAAALALLHHTLAPGWIIPLVIDAVVHPGTHLVTAATVQRLPAEMLLGPSLWIVLQVAHALRTQTVLGRVSTEHETLVKRSKAMKLGWKEDAAAAVDGQTWAHPPGKIRLGLDESRRLFDLDLSEIAQHIAIPGASGSGKTKTLMRLAGGALSNGYAVVIVDAKGVGLTRDVVALAQRFAVPLRIVDPDNPATLGYDPTTGDAAHVANKLVGAFTFTGEAEIYKQVAMEVVPVIVRALQATGQPVSLQRLYDALGKGGLSNLARTAGAEAYRQTLQDLDEAAGIGAAGRLGLQRRLGALVQGKFGPIFSQRPALEWPAATAQPSVTYFSLSATAASEDVELFARVLIQDMKQFADARLRLIEQQQTPIPLLAFFDEFAALREMQQITDLLLQARAARMSLGVSSQFLPQDVAIRTPILQAGVLIAHRLAAEDSEAIAAEFGTHQAPKVTAQVNYETGQSDRGSIRTVQEYNIHPDVLRELPVGVAAVYARRPLRRTLVHVHMDG